MHHIQKVVSVAVLLLSLLVLSPSVHAWPAKVVSVSDGDTITVLRPGNQQVKIRLYGIDCPEKKQSYGQKAKDLTSTLVAGRSVEVEQKDVDRYGRVVGLVRVDGAVLNEAIIQNGFAWVYRDYCKERFCSDWVKYEVAARQQKKGIWADPVIVPPWEWRHSQKETKAEDEASPPVIILGGNAPVTGENSGGKFRCDGRTYCSQMTSCEEATFFLKNCPGTKMDGDHDGVPCESQWCR